MSGRVLSLNIGRREPNPAKDVGVTGIGKRPVTEVEVRPPGPKHGGLGSGLLGDFIGDVEHHGGDRQAVYAFAREELDGWQERLGLEIADGTFGENLTTSGLDVDDARVGDQWAVGDEVVLEVTGPRIPCVTFAHRMGVPGWLRTFTDHARSGAYLSVLSAGKIRTGDVITQVHRSRVDLPLPVVYRAFLGDLGAARLVVEAGILPDDETEWLRARMDRRAR